LCHGIDLVETLSWRTRLRVSEELRWRLLWRGLRELLERLRRVSLWWLLCCSCSLAFDMGLEFSLLEVEDPERSQAGSFKGC
jgi:hypothetical protein